MRIAAKKMMRTIWILIFADLFLYLNRLGGQPWKSSNLQSEYITEKSTGISRRILKRRVCYIEWTIGGIACQQTGKPPSATSLEGYLRYHWKIYVPGGVAWAEAPIEYSKGR